MTGIAVDRTDITGILCAPSVGLPPGFRVAFVILIGFCAVTHLSFAEDSVALVAAIELTEAGTVKPKGSIAEVIGDVYGLFDMIVDGAGYAVHHAERDAIGAAVPEKALLVKIVFVA
jgi:hypothetical protein